jgi:hypothetical protein
MRRPTRPLSVLTSQHYQRMSQAPLAFFWQILNHSDLARSTGQCHPPLLLLVFLDFCDYPITKDLITSIFRQQSL